MLLLPPVSGLPPAVPPWARISPRAISRHRPDPSPDLFTLIYAENAKILRAPGHFF